MPLGSIIWYIMWPGLFVYLRFGTRTRVIISVNDQILLVKGWIDPDVWGLPGGGLHRGEAIAQGAAREIREETEIVSEPAAYQLLASEWLRSNGLKSYSHYLSLQLPEAVTPQLQKREIRAAQWFPLSQIGQLKRNAGVDRAVQLLAAKS